MADQIKANQITQDRPVSEGVGSAGGAVAGMAAGAAIGGPPGALIGAAIGAVAGGVAGHGIAAALDPDEQDAYWRENYHTRPYVRDGAPYDDYQDAYRYGWESRAARTGAWDTSSRDLEQGWGSAKTTSRLAWHDAKEAVRDGWNHVERALPGDADGDGR